MSDTPRSPGPISVTQTTRYCIDYAGSTTGSAVAACKHATCLNDRVPACIHPKWKGLRHDITTYQARTPDWCPYLTGDLKPDSRID